MTYLIDYCIVYVVGSGVLVIEGEEESSIRISSQAARLLQELIIRNGQLLERDYLIKTVWEDYGHSGSSMSLNVTISELRKGFRILGRSPSLIKTFRGKGFCLDANIVYTDGPPISELSGEAIIKDYSQSSKCRIILDYLQVLMPYKFPVINILYKILILFCVLAIIIIIITPSFSTIQKIYPTLGFAGNVSHCSVFFIDKKMFNSTQHNLEKVKVLIDNNNINCIQGSVDVYYSDFKRTQRENYFLGVCYQQSNFRDYIYCVSYRGIYGK